jgi:hypothetical protein
VLNGRRLRAAPLVAAMALLSMGQAVDPDAGRSGRTMANEPQRLVGTWLHSQEEDTATHLVYRPAHFDFPPARRARPGYEFRADHSCQALGASPRDGWSRQDCTWEWREGTPPEIVMTFPGGQRDVLPVESIDADRLVIRKPAA